MNKSPKFRPATRKDVEEFYGAGVMPSVKAWVVEHEGVVLGIGGLSYNKDQIIAFTKYKPELDKWPVTKGRGAKKMQEIMGDVPCIAQASPDYPGSRDLLERVGFTNIGEGLYLWAKS